MHELKLKPKANIIEEKIKSAVEKINYPNKNEVVNILNFNLVESIR